MVLQKTTLRLQTGPNSQVNIFHIQNFLGQWAKLAVEVEKSLSLPIGMVIVWDIIYKWEHDTGEGSSVPEFQPIMYGYASVMDKDSLIIEARYPYAVRIWHDGWHADCIGEGVAHVPEVETPGSIAQHFQEQLGLEMV